VGSSDKHMARQMKGMLKVSHAIDVELVNLPEELTDEAVPPPPRPFNLATCQNLFHVMLYGAFICFV